MATEPAGLVAGGIGGGAAGFAAGMSVCPGGAAFSGNGGGGGGSTKETPQSNPEKFKPVRGTSAKVNTETGEVFVKDKSGHGGDHYEVYRNIRDFESGSRAYQVWADGSVGRSY